MVRNGNLTIQSPVTFYNNGASGAGTIIVKGDLRISAPITYEGSAVASVKKTPSVAWIVIKDDNENGGNIIIDNCIPAPFPTSPAGAVILSGAFIAEGTISTGHGGSSKGDKGAALPNSSNPCPAGSFGDNDLPLQVNGMMMANEFKFQRVYTGNDTGAESIRDDGRLIVNPHPGLEEAAKALPVWRSNRFVP